MWHDCQYVVRSIQDKMTKCETVPGEIQRPELNYNNKRQTVMANSNQPHLQEDRLLCVLDS